MEKMRAMVLSKCGKIETNPLKITIIDRHEIQRANEILLKIEACGVCHSQLHGIEGDWKDLGNSSNIANCSRSRSSRKSSTNMETKLQNLRLEIEQESLHFLRHVKYANTVKKGKEYLCESSIITGESFKGGYTEFITVIEDFATKIPDSMKPEYAAPLFCAGITGYKAVKAIEPKSHKKIGIFGIGGVGHMAVQFARIENCDVIAISRNQNHLDVCKKIRCNGYNKIL